MTAAILEFMVAILSEPRTNQTNRAPCSLRPSVDPVEQKLERRMRLRTLEDLRAIEQQPALADARLDGDHTIPQILLPPCPPARERRGRVEPGQRRYARRLRALTQFPHRAVVEEEVGFSGEAPRGGLGGAAARGPGSPQGWFSRRRWFSAAGPPWQAGWCRRARAAPTRARSTSAASVAGRSPSDGFRWARRDAGQDSSRRRRSPRSFHPVRRTP